MLCGWCTYAAHAELSFFPGDWERVSVWVCSSTKRVQRLLLSQHGWNAEFDCTAGECMLENGTHPVVYAALFSHANYPHPSPAWVYQEVYHMLCVLFGL
jgi:Vacuolar protein sorting-associated protein 62